MRVRRGSNARVLALLVVMLLEGRALPTTAQGRGAGDATSTPAGSVPEGTVTGFVRVDGDTLPLKHVYGFVAPDSADGKGVVTLILATSMPIPAEPLATVATRRDLTRLLVNGAIIELKPAGKHSVFLRHGALAGQEIETAGDLTMTMSTTERVSGTVVTSLAGNERKFGYAVRFEITFDVPVIRTITTLR